MHQLPIENEVVPCFISASIVHRPQQHTPTQRRPHLGPGRPTPTPQHVPEDHHPRLHGHPVQPNDNAQHVRPSDPRRGRPRGAHLLPLSQNQLQYRSAILPLHHLRPRLHHPQLPTSPVSQSLSLREERLRRDHATLRLQLAGIPQLRQLSGRFRVGEALRLGQPLLRPIHHPQHGRHRRQPPRPQAQDPVRSRFRLCVPGTIQSTRRVRVLLPSR